MVVLAAARLLSLGSYGVDEDIIEEHAVSVGSEEKPAPILVDVSLGTTSTELSDLI